MRKSPHVVNVKDGKARAGRKEISQARKRSRNPIFTCFNVFLALAVFEAIVLLSIGFFSNQLALDSLKSPLEHFMMAGFYEDGGDDDIVNLEEGLAARTEERLAAFEDDEVSSGAPLDDYYSRPHSSTPVPVIVGGTDGSGTRAFADVLGQLGVPVLVDDARTLDVHAESMFDGQGWPPLARMVLEETRSPNYEIQYLSHETRTEAVSELRKLTRHYDGRFRRLKHKAEASNITVASKVTYAYKAPVSMLIVPLLKYVNKGGMKYIHIVRDGRDIALSSNQSPVRKFYKYSYPDAETRMSRYANTEMAPVLGVQLWNDWNTDLLEWERSHADGKEFDFLVMRTEDLLDPVKKFESLVQLADFLGSPRTMEELCCLSQKAVADLGMSGGAGGSRFGSRVFERYRQMRQQAGGGRASQSLRKRLRRDGDESAAIMMEGRGRISKTADFLSKAKTQEKADISDHFQAIGRKVAERVRQRREGAQHRNRSEGTKRKLTSLFDRKQEYVAHVRPADADGERLSNFGWHRPPADRLGRSETQDKGQFHANSAKVFGRDKAAPLEQRYGKWATMLKEKPEVSSKLHSEGRLGLAAFGYEPRARFMDRMEAHTDFQCDDRVVCEDIIIAGTSSRDQMIDAGSGDQMTV